MIKFCRLLHRNIQSSIPYLRKIEVTTPSNIAFLKYWGKLDEEYMIPLNDNYSVTLNDLVSTTTIYASENLNSHSLQLNGEDVEVTARLENLIKIATEYESSDESLEDCFFRIESTNNFPTAAGLASSASGLGSIAFGLCNILGVDDPRIWSCVSRIGSGSACRSMFGGWVKWIVDDDNEPNPYFSSYGVQLYDENHWDDLRIMILIVEDQKKKISSSYGMQQSRENSERLVERLNFFIPSIVDDMERSIETKDCELFFNLMMEDCENFHNVCLDTTPILEYRNETSLLICDLVNEFNEGKKRVCVGYTFDAGPNAILFFENDFVMEEFREWIESVLSIGKGPDSQVSNIISTRIGPGPMIKSYEEI